MSAGTEVKMLMDGGLASGLLVSRARLKEGFCRIPTAEVVLRSKGRALRMDELEGYVEHPAALEIVRTDAATTRRTVRWFSGMVTSVEGCGAVAESHGSDVFEYRMTIQPKLVNLCYARSGYNFRGVTVLRAVQEILKGLEVTYHEDGIPASAKMPRDFFQHQESDYAFLMRIMSSCGLCYAVRSPVQRGGQVSPPAMHVGAADSLPAASDFLCDGKPVLPSAFSCALGRTSAAFCRMDTWRMRKAIGVDGVDVGYTNRVGRDVRGTAGGVGVRHVTMNEGLSSDSGQDEIDRLAEEHLRRLRLPTTGWSGSTQCLEAMSGNRLKVSHFYGRNTEDVIEATVFASTLECTVSVLSDELGPGADEEVALHIAIRCVAQDRSSAVSAGDVSADSVSAGDVAAAPGVGLAGAAVAVNGGGGGGLMVPVVKQATVVGISGSATDKNAAVKFVAGRGYVFRAVADNESQPFEVNFTQPVGGFGQGLFRMPRIGDRILVFDQTQAGGDVYYLLGYLPGANMPFTTAAELSRTCDDQACQTTLPEEMMAMRFQSPGRVPSDAEIDPDVNIRRKREGNVCSELAFYNTHTSKKWDSKGKEVDESFDAAAVRQDISDEWYGKKYESLDAAQKEKVDAECARRMSVFAQQNVLANFQSIGSMQLTANHNIEMNAQNLHICSAGRSGWQKKKGEDGADKGGYKMDPNTGLLTIDDFNNVVVDVKRSITLKVGHNYITVNQNGISIRSLKRTETGAPMDSYIYMDAISGTSIGGISCSMNGFMGVSIGDRLGASLSLGAGTASLSGISASLGTFNGPDYVLNTALALEEIITGIVGLANPTSEDVAGNIWIAQSAFDTAIEGYRAVSDCYARYNANGAQKADRVIAVVSTVMKLIMLIVDIVRIGIEAKHDDWMSSPVAGCGGDGADSEDNRDWMTNRDAFRYTVLAAKFGLWVTDIVGAYMAFAAADASFWTASSFALSAGKIEVEAKEQSALYLKKTDNNNLLAGLRPPEAQAPDVVAPPPANAPPAVGGIP